MVEDMAEAGLEGNVYRLDGPEGAAPLVLVGSLGTTTSVWDKQMPVLVQHFRVVRIEHPGHGDAPLAAGTGTVEALGERLLGLLGQLGIADAHFAGVSLGGLVGMWLGAMHPERVRRLVLCSTRARFEPPEAFMERARAVRAQGTGSIVQPTLGRWFTGPFLSAHPEVAAEVGAMVAGTKPEGYAYCAEAVARADLSADLAGIEAPTLVVGGALDPVITPEVALATMKAIPGASLFVISGASHLAHVERPGPFNDALLAHLRAE